jgi:hypothetical protein
MENAIRNTIKYMLFGMFAGAIFLLTPKTVHAEVKTCEIEMIDVGDGIKVPAEYNNLKVKNEKGEYYVLPNPTEQTYEPVPIPFEKCTYGDIGWQMEKELEGGYKVTEYYAVDLRPNPEIVMRPQAEGLRPVKNTKYGYPYYEITDVAGNLICTYGFTSDYNFIRGERLVYQMMIAEEDGDISYTSYGDIHPLLYEDGSYELAVQRLEKPVAIAYKDVERQIQETYISSTIAENDGELYQSGLYLSNRTTLKDGEIDICYMYDYDTPAWHEKNNSTPVIGDGSEESYMRMWYDCKDLENWRFEIPLGKDYQKGSTVPPQRYLDRQIPTVVHPRYSDEAFYALKIQYFKPELMREGECKEDFWYFTKEDYDFLVANNITSAEVIFSQYPEMTIKYSEALYDHEATINALNKAMRQHRDAISKITQVNTEEEPKDGEGAEDSKTSGENAGATPQYREGYPYYTQKITGDVVPINGMTPTMCETWIKDGHYHVSLYDDNWNRVCKQDLPAGDWYTHQYVYFTFLSVMDNNTVVFQIAGSDSPVSGNINYVQESDIETENGYTGSTDYINRDDYSGPLDQYEGQQEIEYQTPTLNVPNED